MKKGKAKPKTKSKSKTSISKTSDKHGLYELNKKLDTILDVQSQILGKEINIEEHEKALDYDEKSHLEKLHEIEDFAKKMKADLGAHPLLRITHRDIAKGSIGAFFGVAAHYTFVYGVKVAHQIDMTRAIITFILAYLVGGVFLYLTGFRQVKMQRIAFFLPFRLTVIYLTAILTAFLILWLFQPDFLHSFEDAFKALATVTLSATIGACTADLIGRE